MVVNIMLLVDQAGISCINRQYTEGAPSTTFLILKKPKLYHKLVNFVRDHRPDFNP